MSLSPDRESYRPISITPILSTVYEKLVPYKFSSFCAKNGLIPAAQFPYRKGHHLQKSLDVRWSRT